MDLNRKIISFCSDLAALKMQKHSTQLQRQLSFGGRQCRLQIEILAVALHFPGAVIYAAISAGRGVKRAVLEKLRRKSSGAM
jgi:hypothetical protein